MIKDKYNMKTTHKHMPLLGYASLVASNVVIKYRVGVLEVALLSKDPVASKRLPRIKGSGTLGLLLRCPTIALVTTLSLNRIDPNASNDGATYLSMVG